MVAVVRMLCRVVVLVSVFVCISLNSCDTSVRKRPDGFLKIGKVSDFLDAEVYLPDKRLMVRHDQRGISVMSTECTHDLSPLKKIEAGDSYIFASQYSDSKYDNLGRVISGPAKAPLPYYRVELASNSYESQVRDTLYVHIGKEVSIDWRLPIQGE